MICHGDDTIWAGARKGVAKNFPQFLPMEQEGGYEIIRQAFTGEFDGLDAKTLQPSKSTSRTVQAFVQKQQLQSVVAKLDNK